MWKCAERALYIPVGSDVAFPGAKVNRQLFDDPLRAAETREDWPKIVTCLMEVNCKPFLAQALSGLLKPKAKSSESQTSKST